MSALGLGATPATLPGSSRRDYALDLLTPTIEAAAESELRAAAMQDGPVRDAFIEWLWDEHEIAPFYNDMDAEPIAWFVNDLRTRNAYLWQRQCELCAAELMEEWR